MRLSPFLHTHVLFTLRQLLGSIEVIIEDWKTVISLCAKHFALSLIISISYGTDALNWFAPGSSVTLISCTYSLMYLFVIVIDVVNTDLTSLFDISVYHL